MDCDDPHSRQGQDPLDAALAGACGTYCGGCLGYHGEVAGAAASLLDKIRRQGFLSLAKRLDPADAGRIDAFLDVLDRLGRTPLCPGCGRGGGTPGCPVRICARTRDHLTCATCADLAGCARGGSGPSLLRAGEDERKRRSELREDGARAHPFTASEFLRRLTRKYGGWNLENLERIRAFGLETRLLEMSKDPNFRTVSVKSEEDVFAEGDERSSGPGESHE